MAGIITARDLFAPAFWRAWSAIYNHTCETVCCSGGRGSGKSSFTSEAIILMMEKRRREALARKAAGDRNWQDAATHAACFRKVGATLADSCFSQFEWAIDKLGLTSRYKFRRNPMSIERVGTNQRIYFRGLDDPQKCRSIKPKTSYIETCWWEELTEFDGLEEVQDVTRSIQRGGGRFMTYYTYNPPETASNWVNFELAELERVDPTFMRFHSDYRAVAKLHREWLGDKFLRDAEILRLRNERAYRHQYLGEITGNGGTIFPNVKKIRLSDEQIARFDNIRWGADFGLRDPTVLIGVQYFSSTNSIVIFDEVYRPDMTLDEIELEFNRHHFGYEYIVGDTAAEQLIVSLRARGMQILPALKGPGSIMNGIKWLQSLDAIYIDPDRCPNTYREFVHYEYVKNLKTNTFTGRLPEVDNHSIDACLRGDTVVWSTTHGPVEIKELCGRAGRLMALDEASGRIVEADFRNVRLARREAPTLAVYHRGGRVVCTEDHRLLTADRGWQEAQAVLRSDRLVTSDGPRPVTSIRRVVGASDVYDLEVPGLHNFAVNGGAIVHNCRYACEKLSQTYSMFN